MLHILRRAVKSWVAKALIALLIASFAVWGIGDIFSFRLSSQVARVGEHEIPAERLVSALQAQRARLSQQAGDLVSFRDMRAVGLDRQILTRLMRQAAFAEELDALGLSASDEAVARAIREDRNFQGPDGEFSQSRYRLALSRMGFTPPEFEALTRDALGRQVLRYAATAGEARLPGLAQRLAAHQGERRRIRVVTLPLSAAADPGTPGDAELRSYYEKHEQNYVAPERRWGRYLHVDIAALAESATPDEEAVRAAYEAEISAYTRPATRRIDQLPLGPRDPGRIAERLRSGEIGFDALARELGEDPADLSLGEVERDDLPETIAEAVFAVDEPGIVGPVEGPAGPVLIRITGVQQGGTRPFEEVRDEIAARLARNAALENAPQLANRIEDMRAGGASLEEIGAEPGITFGTFDGLGPEGSLAGGGEAEGILSSERFLTEAFTALDAEEREILDLPDGGFLLIMVDRIEPSALQPLEEVRDQVVADWRRAERLASLERRIERRATGRDLAAIASDFGADIAEHGPFDRSGAPEMLTPELSETVFSAEPGTLHYGPMPGGRGVVIVEVTEVIPLAPAEMAELSEQIGAQLDRLVRRDRVEYFARAIEASHDRSVDSAAVEEVFNYLGAAQGGG